MDSVFNMEDERGKFISTMFGIRRRETEGTSLPRMKQRLFGHRISQSQSLLRRDLRGHFGCVNAIEFSSDGELIASGGDDRRLLLWKVGEAIYDVKPPEVIDTLHISNINSCCFDASNNKVATGGNDGQVIVHDFSVRQSTAVYGLSDAIYCLSPDPVNATIMATASDDGKAQILDTRLPTDSTPFVLADLDSAMHSIMYNPVDPRLLATANSKHGIGLWDIRMPLKCLNYKRSCRSVNYRSSIQNCMSVRFNSRGDQILALRRRASPVLYDIGKMHPIYEFDYKTYYNACTLKSCSFAGLQDEYVMSGSDDFCIYLWKIPSDISQNYVQAEPHMILKGHRSIVNQVRYCPHNQFIISSGVEKLIKLWSPYSIPGSSGHLVHSRRYGDDDEIERNAYSHEEYIHMVLQAGSFLSHDYTNGSTEEEPCMIAFFDSLIQREIEQSIKAEDDDDVEERVESSENNNNSDNGDSDGGDKGGGDAGGGGGNSGASEGGAENEEGNTENHTVLNRSASDAPLCSSDPTADAEVTGSSIDVTTAAMANEGEDTNNTVGSAASRLEDSSRPFYMDLGSSSESDSEVDEILSAMYSRYMTSRERAMSSGNRPSGKKISSVIARGKQKDNASKQKTCPRKLQRIREDLQHSEDQFLRDNATSMSILADVIDSFVDNLVASESNNSRTLSDTNDGHMSTDSGSNNTRENNSTPEEVNQQTVTLQCDPMSVVNGGANRHHQSSQVSQSSGSTTQTAPSVPVTLDSGMYFMPELEAFAPESYNAVIGMENGATSGLANDDTNHSNLRGLERGRGENKHKGSLNGKTLAKTKENGYENKVSNIHKGSAKETNNNHHSSSSSNDSTISDKVSGLKPQNGASPVNPFHCVSMDRTNSDAAFRSIMRHAKNPAMAGGNNNNCKNFRNGNKIDANPETKNGVGSKRLLAKPCSDFRGNCRISNSSSSSSLSSSPGSSSGSSRYFGSSSSLSSSSSENNLRSDRDVNNSKNEFQTPQVPKDSKKMESSKVPFKKAKVKGRRFRVTRSDSQSSSDEEER